MDAIGAIANEEVVNFTLNDREVLRQPQRLLHSRRVQLPISLGARTPDGWAFAAVEQAKLNATGIGDAAHQAIQRVDLAHQVPFAEPPDRRVARHRADGRKLLRDQRRPCTHARSRRRGFAAGMAATDDDDIKARFYRVLHNSELVAAAKSAVKTPFHVKHSALR